MKKFKNNLQVYGTESLLEAFEKELIKLGYTHKEDTGRGCVTAYANGKFCRRSNLDWLYATIKLPQDWEKGLKLAAERAEEERAEEEITEYKGWKVGDTIEIADIIRAFPDRIKSTPKIGEKEKSASHEFPPVRRIISFEKKEKVYMKVSGTLECSRIVADTLPSKEEWEQKKRIDKEVKESGLKIGDRGIFHGKTYKSKKSPHWTDHFSDIHKQYFITNFEIVDNHVCVGVIHDFGSTVFYIKLSDLEKPKIVIEGYEMKVKDNTAHFGCVEINQRDLFTLHKLVEKTSVKIGDTEVTKELLKQISDVIK